MTSDIEVGDLSIRAHCLPYGHFFGDEDAMDSSDEGGLNDAAALHDAALVVDGTCPLLVRPHYVDWYIEGGVNIVTPTVGATGTAMQSFGLIAYWLEFMRDRQDLTLVSNAAEVRAAKQANRTGVVFHFQGTDPIESELRHIDAFSQLGVGIMQLCYNVEDAAGFGAQVPDGGLKPFGRELVKRCNEAQVIVDCAHTGHATSIILCPSPESTTSGWALTITSASTWSQMMRKR